MTQDERKNFRLILLFALISLLFHGGLLIFFLKVHPSSSAQLGNTPPPQEVVWVQPQALPQPAVVPGAAQPMELADIAKPKVEKIPLKPRFKSQYNSSVAQQTVAIKQPKNARPDVETSEEDGKNGDNAKQPGPKAPKEVAEAPKGEEPQDLPKEKTEPSKENPDEKKVSLNDLALKPADFKDLMEKEKSVKKPDKEPGSQQGKDTTNLGPTFGKMGLPGMGDNFVQDFLPGIKIGGKTYLDAAAFPDVAYFTRLKRVFRLRFNPAPPLRQYFSGNKVVLGKVNVTMAVTVAPGGQLKDLFVVKSSGIPGYDAEALQTIRESAPFSAPPTKVCDKDGMLRMTWNFITYL